MRKLVLSSFMSLDGFSCDPGTELYELLMELEDPEQEEYGLARLRQVGAVECRVPPGGSRLRQAMP